MDGDGRDSGVHGSLSKYLVSECHRGNKLAEAGEVWMIDYGTECSWNPSRLLSVPLKLSRKATTDIVR